MWREYLWYAATAFAVLNGLIAMLIAVLPVRRSVQKLRLGAAALVLAALAVGATFYSKYSTVRQFAREQTERTDVHTQLESLLAEGRKLLVQIKDERAELPSRAADEWAQRAENYLRDRLGDAYIQRFRRDMSDLYGENVAIAVGRVAYFRAVRDRVANLEVMSGEFIEPPPRPLPAPTTK